MYSDQLSSRYKGLLIVPVRRPMCFYCCTQCTLVRGANPADKTSHCPWMPGWICQGGGNWIVWGTRYACFIHFCFDQETLQNTISEEFAHLDFPYSKHYSVHFFTNDIPPSLKKKNSSKTKRPVFGQICPSLSHVESYWNEYYVWCFCLHFTSWRQGIHLEPWWANFKCETVFTEL